MTHTFDGTVLCFENNQNNFLVGFFSHTLLQTEVKTLDDILAMINISS